MEEEQQQQQQQPLSLIIKVLEALKQASRDLQAHPPDPGSTPPSVKALLELETESDTILSKDPNLSSLSLHLTHLRSLLHDRSNKGSTGLIRSFLTRRVSTHSISRVAGSIESEIQAWIDRESLESLSKGLKEGALGVSEEEVVTLLDRFEARVASGFDRELQDLVLKSRVLGDLERVLCDSSARHPTRVREGCASAISALFRFNKDVFVGEVKMGPLVHSLVSVATCKSIKVLSSLIRCIKSPLVDEVVSNGEIPRIISYLGSKELGVKVAAFECVLDVGYFGRKEAVEAMIGEGLVVERLVELQRSELGGDLIDLGRFSAKEEEGGGRRSESRQRQFLEVHPFASCMARFWVQLEVGEGLRQGEKRAYKLEILERVREACVLDAEAATIVAEVLWGSSP